MAESFSLETIEPELVPSGLNRRYLRPADLRRLRALFFSGRRAIEGQYSGRHASRQRGHSVEFRDYREYLPGDDLGSVDWKVFGRSDRLVVKIYEHQTELTVNLLVDASASMAYRGAGERSKYDQACALAAALAFLVCKQHDRVSLAFAQNGLQHHQRAQGSMTHLAALLDLMERVRPRNAAGLPQALRDLAGATRRRDLTIVLSDLWEDREEIRRSLAVPLARGGEVILFHILHADELELPRWEHGLFIDSETGERLRVNVPDVRAVYAERLRGHLDGWRRAAAGAGIDYNLVSTAEPYHLALERYLFRRAERM
jgi:uncharacterized protein (DUF58 family)